MDRIIQYFNLLVAKATAKLPYAGHYPYSVVSCDPIAQTLSARSLSSVVPDLTNVPMVTPGLLLMCQPGTQIQIGFRGLLSTDPYVASYGKGGTSEIKNEVDLGWIGLAQAVPTASTLTVTMIPAGTFPEPAPVAPPNTPTVLSPVPVYFELSGVVTDSAPVI